MLFVRRASARIGPFSVSAVHHFSNTRKDKAMASSVPRVKLNNGQSIPILGLGTWGSPQGEVAQAVKDAIDVGYRHIDGAHVYQNEHEVGEGVNAKIKEGVIKREDIFITSKLWNTFHRPELVEGACRTTLKNLGLDYVDLYLIHWPMGYREGDALFPTDENGKTAYSDVDYVDTWKEMEKLVELGLAKSIGISNFNSKQVERILAIAKVKPVTNQVECHPYLAQVKLSSFCAERDLVITAYSPLGSPNRPWAKPDDPQLMEDPKIVSIAKKYNKTPAQILIRYQIQRGHVVIPKSVNKARIQSNFEVFDFELSEDDMKLVTSFDCNGRVVPISREDTNPHIPFREEF
ncbi:aldo-keto reductase family 1 member B1-like isoform X2 [Toxorhynchites rutilus septentrionalis]|uniref:aldo-keto reductase family 1 member B1-like isoform X2 n=1 Tax=Toxorhynchites rutilus septentrionalis TaxID=329112 RepID=UPI00247ABEAD|nr:aldo-keto reductase family 1 member B1-like isoform X2 [Toxorhynchites rutilus septentrionalis]